MAWRGKIRAKSWRIDGDGFGERNDGGGVRVGDVGERPGKGDWMRLTERYEDC